MKAALTGGLADVLDSGGHNIIVRDIGDVGDTQGREIAGTEVSPLVCKLLADLLSAVERT